jgi:succinyl-diaminopimelate desuccinylase
VNDLIDFIKKLVSFCGISPGCGGAIDFLHDYLKGCGFVCSICAFSGLKNLIATTNNNKQIDLCFAGHVDVVPPGDFNLWKCNPFCALVEDDVIYGRGVVDMKAAICCFIFAAKKLLKYSNFNIGIIITSDEESDSQKGMAPIVKYLIENQYIIEECIIGEPTCKNVVGDTIKIGRRGSINFIVKVYGKQGHVAYPQNAKNPIDFSLEALQKLKSYKFDNGTKSFAPSSCQITDICVPNAFCNMIPAAVQISFNIRFNNNHNVDSLSLKIKEIFYSKDFGCEICHLSNPAEPFLSNKSNFAQDFAFSSEKITNIKPQFSTDGGTSDARFLSKITNTLEFGLLSKTAHQVNERAKVSEIKALHLIYHDFLIRRCTFY